MKPGIEISSLLVSKMRDTVDDFIKYDMDLSLDEIENSDSGIKLKYKFTLLSNPANIKIITDGIASLSGPELEISKQLEPDKRNIPIVVNTIYQEIFPFIYMISTSMKIPCPAYRLSQISSTPQSEIKQDEIKQSEIKQSEIKQDEIKQDEIKQDEIKQDEILPVEEQSEETDIVNPASTLEDKPEKTEIPAKATPQDMFQRKNPSSD